MTDTSEPKTPVPVSTAFLLLLVGISAINPLTAFIYITSIPTMTVALSADYTSIQLTLSMFFASVAIAQIFVGLLSDRYGRRPILLIGMVLFAAASLASAFATSLWVLVVARVFQGIGACSGQVVSRAVVRDRYDRERAASVLGYVTMGYAVAPAFGPLLGGLFEQHLSWRWTFGFLFVVGIVAFAGSWKLMPETRRNDAANQTLGSLLKAFASLSAVPVFWAYVLIGAATTAQFFSFMGGISFIADVILDIDPVVFGFYFAMTGFGYVIGNFLTGRFTHSLGLERVMLWGNIFCVAVIMSMGVFAWIGVFNAPIVFTHLLLCGVGQGLVIPNSIVGAISVRPALAGAAAGLMGSIQMGLGAITTMIIGTWLPYNGTIWPVLFMMLVCAAISTLATFAVRGVRY